jgi:hypothetical protein
VRPIPPPTIPAAPALALALALAGCAPSTTATVPPPPQEPTSRTAQRPAPPAGRPASSSREVIPADRQAHPKFTGGTEADRRFADFLRDKSGGMVRQATVGLEKKGLVQVELSDATSPEDALPLTRSILAGASRDFPDRPITLKLFDPSGVLVLTARQRPGEGVRYQIAGEGETRSSDDATSREARTRPDSAAEVLARGGVTEADRKFAAWAEEHSRGMLRYVEADLERHGRLWFGVSKEVKPEDVRDLTKALLQGARKEFPRRELVATAFDPYGERIGRAHFGPDGEVRWEQ